jgi:serine/threonine protein kinase HipA of HipAB toxin-antitoxin module
MRRPLLRLPMLRKTNAHRRCQGDALHVESDQRHNAAGSGQWAAGSGQRLAAIHNSISTSAASLRQLLRQLNNANRMAKVRHDL